MGEFIGERIYAVQGMQRQQISNSMKGIDIDSIGIAPPKQKIQPMDSKPMNGMTLELQKKAKGEKIVIDNTSVDDSIALREYDSIFQALKNRAIKISLNNSKFAMGISTIGFVGGLGYAYKKGSGFWGYVGWSFLFSILGSIAGGGVDKVVTDNNSDSNKIITTELRIQANALLGKTKDSKNPMISKKYFDLKSLMNTLDNNN